MPWGPPPPLSRSHGTHTRQGVDALVSSTLLLLSLLLLLLLLLLSVSSTAPFWRAYVSGPLGVLSVRPRPLHGDPGAVLRDGGEDDPTSLTPRSSAAPCSPRRSSAPGAPSIPIPSARGERSPTRSSWQPLSSDTPIPQFYLRLLSVDPAPPVALDAFFTLRFTRPSATNDWTCYAVRALENAVATRGMMESSAGGGRFDVRRRCEARWRAWVGGVRFRHGFSARA